MEISPAAAAVGGKCSECHLDVVNSFLLGPHGKAAKFVKGSQASTCDTCHRDGARHSQTSRPSHIANPPKLPAAEANAMCLGCHSNDQTHFAWRGNAHERKNMSCVSCHSEHHPKSAAKMLAKRTELELCFTCHQDKRKATLQRSTHLFRTEHNDVKLACASCHNPHGGEGRTMLVASSINALCYDCHAEKRGPFLWEHAPGRSNCNSCHIPHGSNNPSLLKARTTVLCQQCHIHMLWRHQTVAGYDISSFNKGCVNCHSQIHGSNHPSGKTLTH
ncbi:MAG: DmsE family decaheme c-type cytochrome [Acidobacteria bacterium]|nr:DmsE family decaheme c-type cytochrome [Acidobacteriota bacterium]